MLLILFSDYEIIIIIIIDLGILMGVDATKLGVSIHMWCTNIATTLVGASLTWLRKWPFANCQQILFLFILTPF